MSNSGARVKDTGETRDTGQQDTFPRQATVLETLQLFTHDIRSAMSDVVGGLRLIDTHDLSAETRTQIDRVRAAGDTLAALVDAALMAAAGETRIHEAEADTRMDAWLSALAGRWSGRAQAERSSFSVDPGACMPHRLRLAQVTLDRIVGNLIGNALNHARGAPVVLVIEGRPGAGVKLRIVDGGKGYPEAVLREVSERGEASPIGAGAGSGLGLRIVAELSRQAGGHLTLENAEVGGGVATLHLPDQAVVWDSAPAAPCAPPDLSGLRLLVAEDNLTNQTILRQLLGKMQAEVVFVADGVAALEVAAREVFDLALIDIEMPRKSGLEVMRGIRAMEEPRASMPLIALTAYVLRDNREAIYAAGADGIIGKPIASGTAFGRAILRHVGRPDGMPGAEEVLGGRVDDSCGVKLDHARFAALMEVAGPDGRAELLERLDEDLRAVRAALDIAVPDKTIGEIRAQTHILIALAGAVGADRLARLAEVLNIAAKRQRLEDFAGLYGPCRAELGDLITHVAAEARAAPVA